MDIQKIPAPKMRELESPLVWTFLVLWPGLRLHFQTGNASNLQIPDVKLYFQTRYDTFADLRFTALHLKQIR